MEQIKIGELESGLAVSFKGIQLSWVKLGLPCDQLTLIGDLTIDGKSYPVGGKIPVYGENYLNGHQVADYENAVIHTAAPLDVADLKQALKSIFYNVYIHKKD